MRKVRRYLDVSASDIIRRDAVLVIAAYLGAGIRMTATVTEYC
jgi:hypothetical protein